MATDTPSPLRIDVINLTNDELVDLADNAIVELAYRAAVDADDEPFNPDDWDVETFVIPAGV